LKNKSTSYRLQLALAAAITLFAVSATASKAQGPDLDHSNPPGTDFIASRQIPAGTPVKVIVLNNVSSDNSQIGDPVKVKIAPDDTSGVPRSVIFVGRVHNAVPATAKLPGELALRFDGLAPEGRWTPGANGTGPVEEASAHFVGGNSANGSSKDVGIGAAAGAVIGGSRKRKLGDTIEGGLLGALAGLGVEKATTHAASDVEFKSGQEVTITLKHPIIVRTELIAS
jgi:hypothetical protein